jgi:hypothetical protein
MSYPPPPPDPNQPPGPPGHFTPPPGYPVQPAGAKKSNKKLIFGIIGGVVGLCCVGGTIAAIANGGDGKPEAAATIAATTPGVKKATGKVPAKTVAPQAAPPTVQVAAPKFGPGFGDAVRDGKFEFVVHSMDCKKTKVGNEYLNKKAQGKFCQISVTVKNIGNESQTFSGGAQKTSDAKGTEFSNDGTAEMYANEDASTFLNEINPGNQAKGNLIFDVPKSTTLTTVELHDSPFSGGVKVNLA